MKFRKVSAIIRPERLEAVEVCLKKLEDMKIVGMIIYGNYFDMADNIHTI